MGFYSSSLLVWIPCTSFAYCSITIDTLLRILAEFFRLLVFAFSLVITIILLCYMICVFEDIIFVTCFKASII